MAVIAEMLGIPESDRAPLRPWSADICGMYELNPSEETAARAVRASVEFSDVSAGADRARAARTRATDLISGLIAAHDEGDRLTEQEMISTCVLLLNAGHEATVNATVNGWWALFRNPEQLAALRADHSLRADGGGGADAVRHPAAAVRAVGAGRHRDRRHDRSRAARRSRCCSARPTTTRRVFARPRDAGPHPRRTTRTSPSARASTTASAPRWPVIELAAPSVRCCAEAPGLRLVAEPEWHAGYVIRGLRELRVTCWRVERVHAAPAAPLDAASRGGGSARGPDRATGSRP